MYIAQCAAIASTYEIDHALLGLTDQAVQRANASEYGLGASVWSPDVRRATAVAERLRAGTVWVNRHPHLSPHVPFGSMRQSGLGVESSVYGLQAYTDLTVLDVKRG